MRRTTTGRSMALRAIPTAVLFALAGMAGAQQNTTYSYEYDANGNLTKITDPLGRVTNQSYDALNRLTQQLQPAPIPGAARPTIAYTYDGLDELLTVTDPRNLVTAYTIDGLGNQSALSSPDTGNTSNTYDAAGNLITRTDAKGQTTSYTYDVLNRITTIAYADGTSVSYGYDQGANGKGRLTSMTDISGTTQYSYDLHGRVTSEVRTLNNHAYTTGYRYDTAGRLTGMTYPSGRSIDYVRDGIGRISQITTSKDGVTQTLVSQVSYQPFGPVKSVTFGNGRTSTRSYDLDGRTTSYTLNNQVQTISYDAASRITALTDAATPGSPASYGYDDLDRLTSYLRPDRSLNYTYDPVGNRTSEGNGAATTTYSYAPTGNRLTQIAGSTTRTINSDANGSITDNGANQFSYDARGRMVSATTAIGLVQYKINGLGQRVQKVTPDETTVFHYDRNGKLIGERTGQASMDYVYLDDMPVAVLKQ